MVAILVTGMSGPGTSTGGVSASWTPTGGGYSVETWSAAESRHEQLWREDRIDELLTQHEEDAPGDPLLVAGCVTDQGGSVLASPPRCC